MLASDLAAALALYNDYTSIKTVRDLLTVENVGSIDLKFLNHAETPSVVATSSLLGDVVATSSLLGDRSEEHTSKHRQLWQRLHC